METATLALQNRYVTKQQNVGCVHTCDTRTRTWCWVGVVVSVAHWQRPQTAATFDHLLANTVGMVSLQREWGRKAVLQTSPSGRRSGVRSGPVRSGPVRSGPVLLNARSPDHGHFCASSCLTYFSDRRPQLAILK